MIKCELLLLDPIAAASSGWILIKCALLLLEPIVATSSEWIFDSSLFLKTKVEPTAVKNSLDTRKSMSRKLHQSRGSTNKWPKKGRTNNMSTPEPTGKEDRKHTNVRRKWKSPNLKDKDDDINTLTTDLDGKFHISLISQTRPNPGPARQVWISIEKINTFAILQCLEVI